MLMYPYTHMNARYNRAMQPPSSSYQCLSLHKHQLVTVQHHKQSHHHICVLPWWSDHADDDGESCGLAQQHQQCTGLKHPRRLTTLFCRENLSALLLHSGQHIEDVYGLISTAAHSIRQQRCCTVTSCCFCQPRFCACTCTIAEQAGPSNVVCK